MFRAAAARPEFRRVIRNAAFMPWSAASIGVVVAASLTLATPRAVLTFPPSRAARCQTSSCGVASSGQNAGPIANSRRGIKLPRTGTGKTGGQTGTSEGREAKPDPPGPVLVQYALLPSSGSHFVAVIVITGQRALGSWSLRFVIPGAQIKLVMWAKWTPIGQDGGIVSGAPWPSGPSGAVRARVVILGTGKPGRPGACVFDGVRCHFRDFSGGQNHWEWDPGQQGQQGGWSGE